jgi:hypothetical protein
MSYKGAVFRKVHFIRSPQSSQSAWDDATKHNKNKKKFLVNAYSTLSGLNLEVVL